MNQESATNNAWITGEGEKDSRGPWMQTISGRQVFPFSFTFADGAKITDIAHSLSMICRFNGHCRVHYSVAEHSMRVAWLLPVKLKLQGLLHDAAEAFLGDSIKPMKCVTEMMGLPFKEQEQKIQAHIAWANGCDYPFDPLVKHCDEILLATEARDLMAKHPAPWIDLPEPLTETIHPMKKDVADWFLTFYSLYKGRKNYGHSDSEILTKEARVQSLLFGTAD